MKRIIFIASLIGICVGVIPITAAAASCEEEAAAVEDPTKEQKNADKAARPNSVSVFNLAYIPAVDGTPCWQLLGQKELLAPLSNDKIN